MLQVQPLSSSQALGDVLRLGGEGAGGPQHGHQPASQICPGMRSVIKVFCNSFVGNRVVKLSAVIVGCTFGISGHNVRPFAGPDALQIHLMQVIMVLLKIADSFHIICQKY
jgi:hypothetical protein